MVECVYVRAQHKPTPWATEADFFHKKIGYALLTFQCLSPNDTLVLSSKQMFKLNQLGSGSWSSNKEKSCNAR